ncbi:hypothetical protein EVAR_98036_1 [Eumeta japonica]|uniref:Uncharacterized protein n=1 Tax=Eumeta variegata TaxID=151549 RepID=A0A4C1ZX55_EUMVA|nr:hypothetical protein EVAR_98036_1 [Eumeta japonica]
MARDRLPTEIAAGARLSIRSLRNLDDGVGDATDILFYLEQESRCRHKDDRKQMLFVQPFSAKAQRKTVNRTHVISAQHQRMPRVSVAIKFTGPASRHVAMRSISRHVRRRPIPSEARVNLSPAARSRRGVLEFSNDTNNFTYMVRAGGSIAVVTKRKLRSNAVDGAGGTNVKGRAHD